jgi:predicted DNA-binding protein (UPF0251 family)
MPRPFCCRRVSGEPPSKFFKPQGIPLTVLEVVTMTVDEYESVRLADLEGLYQEDAAQHMGVSRQTFGRIVESAHRKIAEALVNATALEIKGGEIEMVNQREFLCSDCRHGWQVPYETGRPAACPQCLSRNIHRAPEDRGWARRGGGGQDAGPRRGMHRGRRWRGGGPRANRQGGNE